MFITCKKRFKTPDVIIVNIFMLFMLFKINFKWAKQKNGEKHWSRFLYGYLFSTPVLGTWNLKLKISLEKFQKFDRMDIWTFRFRLKLVFQVQLASVNAILIPFRKYSLKYRVTREEVKLLSSTIFRLDKVHGKNFDRILCFSCLDRSANDLRWNVLKIYLRNSRKPIPQPSRDSKFYQHPRLKHGRR